MTPDDTDPAITQRRDWLDRQLAHSATELNLTGPPVHTCDLRSAGAPSIHNGQKVWLRVVVEDPDHQRNVRPTTTPMITVTA